jgi:cell fate regulator YaaT (PSP1 superfamily)
VVIISLVFLLPNNKLQIFSINAQSIKKASISYKLQIKYCYLSLYLISANTDLKNTDYVLLGLVAVWIGW